jgi:hypothetical protein
LVLVWEIKQFLVPQTFFMKLLIALFCLILSLGVAAQSNEETAVKATIEQLFTAMRTGDSALLVKAFSPTAILQTIVVKKDGSEIVETDNVLDFASSVAKPHKDIYDERISFGAIHIDANLAAAWTPYQFYVGLNFSHCGVNSFQLVKLNKEWKIQYIIDTRRKEDCRTK